MPSTATPQDSSGSTPTIVIENNGGDFSRFVGWALAWIGWLGVFVSLCVIVYLWWGRSEYYDNTGGIRESYHSGNQFAEDKVAIINITGVIYDGQGYVKHQIDRIRLDDRVKAIVVRVDSPGGTVAGSDYIFHHLKHLREEKKIPIVVSMGSMAASGGYYVSMAVGDQEDSIFAEPTTTTGSIGVIIPHYDISGLMERYDVKNDSIVSHERKQMLSMTKKIKDEHRKILKAHVDELFELFKERVKAGRPIFRNDNAALDELATGEIFSAAKAKQFGLVDRIGFIEDAITRAVELAKLKDQPVRVVRYNRPESLIDIPGLAKAPAGQLELATIFELSTPRAYYMATSLPPLVSSGSAD